MTIFGWRRRTQAALPNPGVWFVVLVTVAGLGFAPSFGRAATPPVADPPPQRTDPEAPEPTAEPPTDSQDVVESDSPPEETDADDDKSLFDEVETDADGLMDSDDVPEDTEVEEYRWRGYVQSGIRFTPDEAFDFLRSETTVASRLAARLGPHVAALANVRLVFTERSEPADFAGLTNRSLLDPWRVESDELFVEFRDLGLDGLDMRLGRQVVIWGTADRFHPTSNLNPLDVEDPLQFGESMGNQMLLLRWRPDASAGDQDDPWFDEFNLELVCVPVFKPAQLPNSASLAFTDQDELERRATSPELKGLIAKQKELMQEGWTFAYQPAVILPEHDIRNVMAGGRLGFRLVGVDMSVSYFRGFDDFPRAEKVTNQTLGKDVISTVHLTYPRVQVVGVDMATSLDWLDGLGLWAEVGITFHDDLYRVIDTEPIGGIVVEPERAKGNFVKAVVGTDYSITPTWYVNVQYMHGFLDEFGTDQLDDYIVAGTDIKFARDTVLLRAFGIVNLQDSSFVLFPQIVVKPWNAAEMSVGAFLFLGDNDTKFGSPAAGRSNVFFRGRVSF
jgi:hypothetical protein